MTASVARALLLRALVVAALCLPVAAAFFLGPLPYWSPGDGVGGPSPLSGIAPPAADASAPVWPHLRGPDGTGRSPETGLAEAWPPQGPPVLWTFPLGQGFSGLVVAGERVFTQAQTPLGQFVVALDAASGRRLWAVRYDAPFDPEGHWPGPRATPTWHRGRLYFAGTDGSVGCLDAKDGRQLWSVDLARALHAPALDFGYACTPLVDEGRVVLPVGGPGAALVALDADTGRLLWQAGDGPASYSSALPLTLGGRRCVVALLQNNLLVCDLRSGQAIARLELSEGYDEHAAWPIYSEPHLLIARPFGHGAVRLRLDPAGAAPPCETWANPGFSSDVLSSVLVGDHLYGFSVQALQAGLSEATPGEFVCLDFKTGAVRWTNPGTGHASVLEADGKLLLLNEQGRLMLARADPAAYRELARADVLSGGRCWTQPTLAGGRLFARNHVQAVCVYVGRPEALPEEQRRRARPASELPAAPPSAHVPWSGELLMGGASPAPEPEGAAAPDAGWRDDSLHAPTPAHFLLWFVACLGLFAAAALVEGLRRPLAKRRPAGGNTAHTVFPGFLVCAVLLGACGTPVWALCAGRFVFTWPVAVFAVYAALVDACLAARQDPAPRVAARARLLALLFVGLCGLYCAGCQIGFLPVGPGFLAGLLPAFPVAALAARSSGGRWSPVRRAALYLLAFAVEFWASAWVIWWRMIGAEGG